MISLHDLPYKDKIEMISLKELLPDDIKTTVTLYESEWIENMEREGIDTKNDSLQLEVSKKEIISLRKELFMEIRTMPHEYLNKIYNFTERLLRIPINTQSHFIDALDYIENNYKELSNYFYIDIKISPLNLFLAFIRKYLLYISQAVDFMTKLNLRLAFSNSEIETNPLMDIEMHPLAEIVKRCFSNNTDISDNAQKALSGLLFEGSKEIRWYTIFHACSETTKLLSYSNNIFPNNNDIDNKDLLYNKNMDVSFFGHKIGKYKDILNMIHNLENVKEEIMEKLHKDDSIFKLNEDWCGFLTKQVDTPFACIRTSHGPMYILHVGDKKFILFINDNELRGLNIDNLDEMIIVNKDPNGEYKFKKDDILQKGE